MQVQKSTITFRCAAPGCEASETVDFETLPEVVDESSSWILPAGWGEEEVRVDEKEVYYICCPKHTLVMTPEFRDAPERDSGWKVQ